MFKLSGVVPPMITPFDSEGNLDQAGLEKLLDYLKDRVHGLYICGSYGSGPLMNVEERKRVAEDAVRVVEGKISIIVHTGTTNTRVTVSLTRHARQIGAEAYIPGLGNAFPEICSQMWREGMDNDMDSCRKTQFMVNKLRDIMYLARSTQLAVYTMLEIRGIVTAYPRFPFVPATKQEKERIEQALSELAVL